MTEKSKSRAILTRLTIILFILLVLLTFLSRTIAASMRPTVETTFPRSSDLPESISIIGTVTYPTIQKVVSAGTIRATEIFVEPNDIVSKDAPLCTVDISEYALQNKRFELSILQLRNQLSNSDMPKKTREELNLHLEILLEEQRLHNERYLADGLITAPCAGIVSQSFITAGQTLPADATIFEILPVDASAEVVFRLAPEEAMLYFVGDEATLLYSAEMEVNGERRIMPVSKNAAIQKKQFDPATQQYLYYVPIGSAQIFEGQEIDVRLTKTTGIFNTVLPKSAVHKGSNGQLFVYILKHRDGLWGDEDYVQELFVDQIAENKTHIAIDGSLLARNESIVVSSSGFLSNGQVVRVVTP